MERLAAPDVLICEYPASISKEAPPMVDVEHPNFVTLTPETVAEHWRLYLVEGVILIILGVGAILIPIFASLAVANFLGWLFLIGGVVGAVTTLAGRHAPGFWWSLLSSVVTIIAGFLMVGWPFIGAISLTLVLAAYLATDGLISIFFAIEHNRQLTPRWGWILVNGIVDLLLAGLIVWVLPVGAFWVLGLLVGIDFIFGGATLIAMSLAAPHSKSLH
jgi:uncharacterized membrane protein HdeD (DUF308 family)